MKFPPVGTGAGLETRAQGSVHPTLVKIRRFLINLVLTGRGAAVVDCCGRRAFCDGDIVFVSGRNQPV